MKFEFAIIVIICYSIFNVLNNKGEGIIVVLSKKRS
jgi:hypothetical protein